MDAIKQALQGWLMEKRSLTDDAAVAFDTPLLEGGLLRSIDIAELIIYIEFLRERPVRITELQPGAFASIDRIAETFFMEEPA